MSVLSYSSLTTKVRAMEGHLLTDKEYNEIKALSSVNDVVTYLNNFKSYEKIFKNIDINSLHRGELEKLLNLSLYDDFLKLYNFASNKQRKFFRLVFMRFECSVLKLVFREITEEHKVVSDLHYLIPYYREFSKIDIEKLSECTSIKDSIEALKDTEYYNPLMYVFKNDSYTIFDLELDLDLFCFQTLWHNKDKVLSGTDLSLISDSYGTMMDLLNIMWVYRCKKYYKMDNEEIKALLIPVNYKLKKKELKDMIDADKIETIRDIFNRSAYGKHLHSPEADSYEHIYKIFMDKIHKVNFKNHPYSIACVDTYLYKKQSEIGKLRTLTESIRYSLSQKEIEEILI